MTSLQLPQAADADAAGDPDTPFASRQCSGGGGDVGASHSAPGNDHSPFVEAEPHALDDGFEPDEEWWIRQSESYAESRSRRSGVESVYLPPPKLLLGTAGGNRVLDGISPRPLAHNKVGVRVRALFCSDLFGFGSVVQFVKHPCDMPLTPDTRLLVVVIRRAQPTT